MPSFTFLARLKKMKLNILLTKSPKRDHIYKLEKGFQKKPIVAFTNSTVFILDFNI